MPASTGSVPVWKSLSDEGEASVVVADSPANDQICAGHVAALSEGLDFRCRLKAIVRNGRDCAILRRFVAEMVHGNFGSGTSAFGHCAKSGPQPICRGVDSSTITGTPGELHHQLIGR